MPKTAETVTIQEIAKRNWYYQRCSYWNQPNPFGIMVTQNGANFDYAGNCARKPPSLAVALTAAQDQPS